MAQCRIPTALLVTETCPGASCLHPENRKLWAMSQVMVVPRKSRGHKTTLSSSAARKYFGVPSEP